MLLYIDTSDFNGLRLALVDKNKTREITRAVAFNENYKTNAFLQQFLKQQKVKISEVKKIVVCSGPGSFTGLRVGVALAQALGFALSIPVVAIPKSKVPKDLNKLTTLKGGKAITLRYGQKPNITKPKTRGNKKARRIPNTTTRS
jgi:ArsR family metal-binding transcriptional regulator